MNDERQAQADFDERAIQTDAPVSAEGASAPPSPLTDRSKGNWTAAILGLITVSLLLCTIVTCSAAAIALFTNSRQVTSVSGTVAYRQRIALPPDVVVTVRIDDVSRADAPATTIGQQIIRNPGQVPIPFNVRCNAQDIEDNHSYSVAARIEDPSGKLLFISTQHYPVITRGNPTHDVQVMVEQVGNPAPEPNPGLEGTTWILGNTLPGAQITALFESGTLAGSAGCNSYTGSYTTSPGTGQDGLQIGALATTRMVCEQTIMDRENQYLAALQATTGYQVKGNTLTLFYPGGTLQFGGLATP